MPADPNDDLVSLGPTFGQKYIGDLRTAPTGRPQGNAGDLLAVDNIAPRRYRITFGLSGDVASVTQGIIHTGGLTVPVPEDAFAVRILLMQNLLTPWTVTKVIFNPSSSFNDGYTRTGNAPWQTMTWATTTANTDNDNVVYTSATTSFTVPAASGAADPITGATNIADVYPSDWCPINNITSAQSWPTDNTTQRYMMFRCLIPATTYCRSSSATLGSFLPDPANTNGLQFYSFFRGNDAVTNPDNTFTTPFASGNNIICAVQFMTRTPGITVGNAGDSHMNGTTTTHSLNGFISQACMKLNTPQLPIYQWNTAWGGQNSSTFIPSIQRALIFGQHSIVCFQTWPAAELLLDTTGIYNAFARTLTVCQRLKASGGVPILVTPIPRNAAVINSGNTLAVWRDIRARVLASSGMAVFDASPLIGSTTGGQLDGLYQPAQTTDNIHPNDVGNTTLSYGLMAVLRKVIGI